MRTADVPCGNKWAMIVGVLLPYTDPDITDKMYWGSTYVLKLTDRQTYTPSSPFPTCQTSFFQSLLASVTDVPAQLLLAHERRPEWLKCNFIDGGIWQGGGGRGRVCRLTYRKDICYVRLTLRPAQEKCFLVIILKMTGAWWRRRLGWQRVRWKIWSLSSM